MKVIPPITITDAMLTSSTVAEPAAGETAWVSGTPYVVRNRCIRTTTHRVYECVLNVSGTTPPEDDPSNWLDVGATLRWRMFDLERNSASTGSGTLTVVVAPGRRVSALALVGLVADSVTVTMADGTGTIYTRTDSLLLRNSVSWSDYFFSEFRARSAWVRFDLPLASGATITVTLNRSGGQTVSCGGLVLGVAVDLGGVIDSPVSEALNFSKVDRDDFGNAALVKRRSLPKTRQELLAQKSSVDKLRQVREDLDAVPALWSGLDDQIGNGYFESLLILGIYKEFTISLAHPTHARVSLGLEEI